MGRRWGSRRRRVGKGAGPGRHVEAMRGDRAVPTLSNREVLTPRASDVVKRDQISKDDSCRATVERRSSGFSRGLPGFGLRSRSNIAKREKGLWQRRYWEHAIRDDADLERHLDYIHFNPVKHGYVPRVYDWPYSNFHRYVADGVLPQDWGGDMREITGQFGE